MLSQKTLQNRSGKVKKAKCLCLGGSKTLSRLQIRQLFWELDYKRKKRNQMEPLYIKKATNSFSLTPFRTKVSALAAILVEI